MSFLEIFLLLVTAPLWLPICLAGVFLISVVIGIAIALPIVIIVETFRK